ncbi:MAG: pilus assembly protein PilP [Candidatus Eutrophobiaceae bacterium]
MLVSAIIVPVRMSRYLWPLLALLFLGACTSSDMSDLEARVVAIESRPAPRIKPLPGIKPYQAYEYQGMTVENKLPFVLFFTEHLRKFQSEDIVSDEDVLPSEWRNEMENRNAEELEQFEVDELQMKGTLENSAGVWGLVISPDGVIHRISLSNYVGKNFGKVVEIAEDMIVLREIIKNENGRWVERQAQLVLDEG